MSEIYKQPETNPKQEFYESGKGIPENRSQELWLSCEQAVIDFYHEHFMRLYNNLEDEDDKIDFETDLSEAITGEKLFVDKVLNSIHDNIESSKKMVVLFDVDNTIAVNNIKTDNKTIFRPSTELLMKEIKNIADIGFLTNRNDLSTEKESHLAALKTYVNNSYVYSSRHIVVSGSPEYQKISQSLKDLNRHDLDDTGNIEKLYLFDKISKDNPELNFIVVDDLGYTELLKNKGVHLVGKEQFWL